MLDATQSLPVECANVRVDGDAQWRWVVLRQFIHARLHLYGLMRARFTTIAEINHIAVVIVVREGRLDGRHFLQSNEPVEQSLLLKVVSEHLQLAVRREDRVEVVVLKDESE